MHFRTRWSLSDSAQECGHHWQDQHFVMSCMPLMESATLLGGLHRRGLLSVMTARVRVTTCSLSQTPSSSNNARHPNCTLPHLPLATPHRACMYFNAHCLHTCSLRCAKRGPGGGEGVQLQGHGWGCDLGRAGLKCQVNIRQRQQRLEVAHCHSPVYSLITSSPSREGRETRYRHDAMLHAAH